MNYRCQTCLNSRLIVSENGYHYSCCLTPKQAAECIYDGRHYLEHPAVKIRVKEADE